MENLNDLIKSANLRAEQLYAGEGVEVVGMNDAKTVDVSQIHEKQILVTAGVNGCTVVAALAKYADGKMLAHMSHFDPHSISLQQIELSRLTQQELLEPIVLKIITRGDYVKMNERWILVPQKQSEVDMLTAAAGNEAKIEVSAYSENLEHGEIREARFLLTPGPDGKIDARVRWWGGTERFS